MTPYRTSARPLKPSALEVLAVPLRFKWPKRCVKCGQQAQLERREYTLEREPAWLPLAMLVGLIPFVILRALSRQKATLTLSFCPGCRVRLRDGRTAESVFTIVCLMLGTAIVAFLLNEAWAVSAVLTLLTALGLTWIRRRFILGRTIRLAGVRGDVLLLAGVDADVAQEVRAELSSRRAPKPARRA